MKLSRKLQFLFASLCSIGMGISLFLFLTENSQAPTAEADAVRFIQHGFEFHISAALVFAVGFLLGTAFWIWKLFRRQSE